MKRIFNILYITTLILSSILALNLKLQTKGSLTEADATALMNKYLPVLYFHSSEGYFPTAIESFGIDWSKATLDDSDATIDTNGYKGETSLKSNAPIYCSINENSDGTVRISYLFLYGWNAAGPKIKVYAKMVGVGINESITVGDYGIDLHYSDVEHIEVHLKSDKSTVDYLYYAYHQWGTDSGDKLSSSDITWENGTHPVVYVALGSHASYKGSGSIDYKDLWSEKKSVLGVSVYNTYGELIDSCEKGTRFFTSNPRLLKLDGNQVSGISNDELYIGFKYSGRLGVTYNNNGWNNLKSALGISTIESALKVFSKSAANSLSSDVDTAQSYFESVAPSSFYGRSFW